MLKDRLKEIILRKSFLRDGPYRLTSGGTSDVFFDIKRSLLDPEGSFLVGRLIIDTFLTERVDYVGGLTLGACPIVSSICVSGYFWDIPIKGGFYVDKHTLKVEGQNLRYGDRVVIVDDVATKGHSLLKSIIIAQEYGCDVVKTIVVVDREEGAKELLAADGFTLESLFTRTELEETNEQT